MIFSCYDKMAPKKKTAAPAAKAAAAKSASSKKRAAASPQTQKKALPKMVGGKNASSNKDEYRYTILPVDVDGDGIPDGDIIEKINVKTKVVEKRVFVPKSKIDRIVNRMETAEQQKPVAVVPAANANAPPRAVDPIVRVADKTSFGQSLKTGFGMGIGFAASDALVDGVTGLF